MNKYNFSIKVVVLIKSESVSYVNPQHKYNAETFSVAIFKNC